MADIVTKYADYFSVKTVIGFNGEKYGMFINVLNSTKDKCIYISTLPNNDSKIEALINKKNPGKFKTIRLELTTFSPEIAKLLLDKMETC